MAGSVTISKLNYMLTVDSSNLDKGLQLSRKEVTAMGRQMRALQTPMEKYETRLHKAKNLTKLGADGQRLYNRAIADAADKLKKEERAAWRATKTYKNLQRAKMAVAGVAVGLVTATVASVKRDLEQIDKLAKTSAKLGVDMEQLTGIQFVAAQTSGIAPEQTAKGLEKMVRRTAEAAVGLGEAQSSLKELGLDAKDLITLKPDEMFKRIADKMQTIPNSADKLRLATKIFDDESAGLYTTLQMGADALDANIARGKQLGQTISAIDARKAEQVNDAMLEFQTVWTAFSREFTLSIGPSLTSLIKEITNAMSDMRGKQESGGRQGNLSYGMDLMSGAFRAYNSFEYGKSGLPQIGDIFRAMDSIQHERNVEEAKRRGQDMIAAANAKREKEKTAAEKAAADVQVDATKEFMKLIPSIRFRSSNPGEMGGIAQWMFGGSTPAAKKGGSRGVDVMSSIAGGSAEAFRIEYKRQAKQDKALQEASRTADNTESMVDLFGDFIDRFEIEPSNIS